MDSLVENTRREAYMCLLDAWETDYTEVDGSRSYAVYHTSEFLRRLGVPRTDVQRLSTAANFVIASEMVHA